MLTSFRQSSLCSSAAPRSTSGSATRSTLVLAADRACRVGVLSGLGATVAVFLNGASVLRFQAVCAILMSVAALVLEIVFARRWGVAGVPWALVIAYTVFSAIPIIIYVPLLLKRLSAERAGRPPAAPEDRQPL